MEQATFAELEHEVKKRRTRRELFLEKMDRLIPFGYGKVRYRGLSKNTQRIALLLGFTNLLIAGRYAPA